MQNNWFVGNAIAVMLKKVPVVGNLRTFQNRFVNNEMDFCNETGKPYDSKTGSILWVSENFFYHDSSWQPQKSDLWSEKNGVIYLNYNREGMLLVPNAPSFDETGDYKDDIEAYKAFLPRFSGWTPGICLSACQIAVLRYVLLSQPPRPELLPAVVAGQ